MRHDIKIQQILPCHRILSRAHPLTPGLTTANSPPSTQFDWPTLAKQFLLGSIAVFHEPSRAYVEPWTGDWFGEGGVEQDPHVYPASAAAGVHGEVIMEKLGNATAKYASSVRSKPLHFADSSEL